MKFGVGTILDGYCSGYFGDSYNEKRIEAIGADWIVVREGKIPRMALFDDIEERDDCVREWLKEMKEEEDYSGVEDRCFKGGVHEWGIDGQHSNEYCKKCFISKPSTA